jgi:hypothetical protein
LGGICVAPLLGFQNEAAPFVEVDPAGAGKAVAVLEGDGALEDVGIVPVVGTGGVGTGNSEEVAHLGEKKLVVGPLGGPGRLPAGDEG